jgi:hypothetical protein
MTLASCAHLLSNSFEEINTNAKLQQIHSSLWDLYHEYTGLTIKDSFTSRKSEVLPFLERQVLLLKSCQDAVDVDR